MQQDGRSFVDLERGIFYRKAIGKRATKKRQPPAPVPPRLLAHMRRWSRQKLIADCFVEFNGKPVASVKKGFKTAVRLAGLAGRVTPHTLRHTAATWLMQRGVPVWEAAGFLGMSAGGPAGHLRPPSPRPSAWALRPRLRQRAGTFRWLKRWLSLTEGQNEKKKPNDILVGVAGFEPATPASRTQCSTGLSHTPTRTRLIALGFAHRKKPN